jgi:tetratricopeptide (TPR) repeat protein
LELELSGYYEHTPDPNLPNAALEHLEKAVELDPNNLAAFRKLFYSYLNFETFDRAQAMTDKAKAFGEDEYELQRANLLKVRCKGDANSAQFAEAMAIMKAALARHETFSEGHAMLGELYLDSNPPKLEEARAELNRSFELNPASAGALVNLARLAEAENRAEDHEKWINLAWRYTPNNVYVRNCWLIYQERRATTKSEVDALIRYCELLLRNEQTPENLALLARLYMKADPPRTEVAGQIYRELYRNTAGKPRSLVFLEMYLAYLRQMGRGEEGTQLLEQIGEKETDKAGYFIAYGSHEAALGQQEEAMKCFDAAIRADANDRRSYGAKSALQISMHDLNGATATLRAGVQALPADRQLKVILVNVLVQAEQFDLARQAAAEMVAANPKDLGAMVLQGRALQLAGRIDDARAMYDKVIQANASALEALRFRAAAFIATGEINSAIEDMRAVYRLRPDPATLADISRLQMMRKDLDGARRTLEEGLKTHENNQRLMQVLVGVLVSQGNYDQAMAILNKGQQEVDPNSPAWWIQEAQMWQGRKDVPNAQAKRADALKKALDYDRGNLGLLAEYIDALVDAGRYEELKQLSRSIGEPPPAVGLVLQVAVGRAQLATGNEAQAMDCFRQAYLTCQGEDVGAIEARIRTALGDQRFSLALQQWLGQQDNWTTRLSLAHVLRDGKDTQAQAADLLSHADLSAASNLGKVLVYQDQGYILQGLKRFEEARKAYEAALAMSDVNVPRLRAAILNNLAYLLANDMDKPMEAVEYARQALQLAPSSMEITDTLAWAYYRAGQFDQAEHQLVRAIEMEPTAVYRYHLGMVEEAKGRKEEALRQYRLGFEIVKDNPDDENHRKIKERLAALGAP